MEGFVVSEDDDNENEAEGDDDKSERWFCLSVDVEENELYRVAFY